MSLIAAVIGRLLLALIFIVSGLQKTRRSVGAPRRRCRRPTCRPTFALPTGMFELVAGLLLAVGLMTRLVSILLVGFVALTILFFHNAVHRSRAGRRRRSRTWRSSAGC